MGLPQFTLRIDGTEHQMALEGLKGLAHRVTIDHVNGEVAKVFLEFPSNVTVEGDGVIHVVKGADPREVVLEFLAGVDPGQMEHLALNEFDDPQLTTGQAFKKALEKIARGD